MSQNELMKKYLPFLLITLIISSCIKDTDKRLATEYNSQVVNNWVSLSMDLVKSTPGFTPPVAARTYGYLGLTMYEAALGGMPGYRSMAGQIAGLEVSMLPIPKNVDYNWPIVVNAAAREILEACLANAKSENKLIIQDTYLSTLNKLSDGIDDYQIDQSIIYGREIGRVIAAYAATDRQIQCYLTNFPSNYTPLIGPGYWIPTSAQKIPLQPYWGSVRSLGPGNPDVIYEAPLTYSTEKNSPFYKEGLEVYNVTKVLTEEQKTIAKYWSDDPGTTSTPPGHSMSIANQILKKENANLAQSVETMAKIGMAVHDAFVSCWKGKYQYNLLRPVTYIKANIDANWSTLLNTPPFPEYTSGHSVQSGASAEILESIFGTSYNFVDHTHAYRTDINGTPRSFASFKEFADEAAISRLYGGIHYRKAIDVGVAQGRLVAKNILKLQFQ
jgi:hypothetical protein